MDPVNEGSGAGMCPGACIDGDESEREVLGARWRGLDVGTQAAWLLASRLGGASASGALLDAAGVGWTNRRTLRDLHILQSGPSDRFWLRGRAAWFGRCVAGDSVDREMAHGVFVRGVLRYFRALDISEYSGFLRYLVDRATIDDAVAWAELALRDDLAEHVAVLRNSGAALTRAGAPRKARATFRRAAILEKGRSDPEHVLRVAESLWW